MSLAYGRVARKETQQVFFLCLPKLSHSQTRMVLGSKQIFPKINQNQKSKVKRNHPISHLWGWHQSPVELRAIHSPTVNGMAARSRHRTTSEAQSSRRAYLHIHEVSGFIQWGYQLKYQISFCIFSYAYQILWPDYMLLSNRIHWPATSPCHSR